MRVSVQQHLQESGSGSRATDDEEWKLAEHLGKRYAGFFAQQVKRIPTPVGLHRNARLPGSFPAASLSKTSLTASRPILATRTERIIRQPFDAESTDTCQRQAEFF